MAKAVSSNDMFYKSIGLSNPNKCAKCPACGRSMSERNMIFGPWKMRFLIQCICGKTSNKSANYMDHEDPEEEAIRLWNESVKNKTTVNYGIDNGKNNT